MARAAKVTKDEVFQVADAIEQEGKEVTISAIRDRLGGVGSFTTIGSYRDEWRKMADAGAADLPKMPDSIRNLGPSVWRDAARTFKVEIQKLRQQASDDTQLLKQDLEEALSYARKLEDEGHEHQELLRSVHDELEEERSAKAKLEGRIFELERQIQELQSQAKTMRNNLEMCEKTIAVGR